MTMLPVPTLPKLELRRAPQDRGVRCSCTERYDPLTGAPVPPVMPSSVGTFRNGQNTLNVFYAVCPACNQPYVVITGVGDVSV